MCTAVISLDRSSAVPVLLVSVRDESPGRPWLPPARHWPAHPDLIGGKDLVAGGTWLCVDAAATPPSATCLLNGFGPQAAAHRRRSRGEVALALASRGSLDGLALERYDPFQLVHARSTGVELLRWTGRELIGRTLPDGLHIVVNDGLEGAYRAPQTPAAAATAMRRRIAHLRAELESLPRPSPDEASDARPAGVAWDRWLATIEGRGVPRDDPRALIGAWEFTSGEPMRTTSVSLLAIRAHSVRYDFGVVLPAAIAWRPVEIGPVLGPAAGLPVQAGPRPGGQGRAAGLPAGPAGRLTPRPTRSRT